VQELIPLDTIRNSLQDRRLTVVADKCGLSHPTVKGIAQGNERISLNGGERIE
jgi:hypothetical protein